MQAKTNRSNLLTSQSVKELSHVVTSGPKGTGDPGAARSGSQEGQKQLEHQSLPFDKMTEDRKYRAQRTIFSSERNKHRGTSE